MNSRIVELVSAALLVAACGNGTGNAAKTAPQPAEAQLPKVSVEQVCRKDVPQEGVYTSTVEANVVNHIAPQSVLRIKNVKVEVGDFVSAGQVVAEMDVASLEQARMQLVNDSTEFARIKSLYEVGGVSKSDLDAITLSYNVRRTAYDNLLENTVLRSPISGVITARNYDKGDMFSMGQPLYTVQQISPVKLLVGISEVDYTKVKKGDKVSIVADALPDRVFEGTVSRLYPVIDPQTHTFTAEVKVPNFDRALRPGMFVKVTVKFGMNNSIVVPDRAVVRQLGSGDKFVYVLNGDGTVTYQKVVLGVRIDTEYEVLEGLADDDKVVVDGQLRIKDGVKVNVVE